MSQEDIRLYYSLMRREVEKFDGIYWNLKDHLLLTWLSAGGSESGLKRLWNNPERYLNGRELEKFEAFKEKAIYTVDDMQNGNQVIKDLEIRFK